jgi:hypothetical protein
VRRTAPTPRAEPSSDPTPPRTAMHSMPFASNGRLLARARPHVMQRDQALSFHWAGITDAQLAAAGLPSKGGLKRQLCRRAIVANLICAQHSDRWVSYARDRNAYTGRRRYDGAAYTYTHVRTVVDELEEFGLIHHDRAWPGRAGLRSRMRATLALIRAVGPVDQLEYQPGEVIRLKDYAGRLVDYADTPYTYGIRHEVAAVNDVFRSVNINLVATDVAWNSIAVHLDGAVVHPARVVGHRVFNGGWRSGGRLYGPFWQSLNKQRRRQLTVDGGGVIEHDFAQLHPRLLYAQCGRPIEGDAYTIRGYEGARPAVKLAWQILINAQSPKAAVPALALELGGLEKQAEAARLLQALEDHHRPIAAAFYTGAGLTLQRCDSDLMMAILRQCLSEAIVALPVHDSLIAPEGVRSDRVQEIMNAHLERILLQH